MEVIKRNAFIQGQVIYTEHDKWPEGFDVNFAGTNNSVVWGFKEEVELSNLIYAKGIKGLYLIGISDDYDKDSLELLANVNGKDVIALIALKGSSNILNKIKSVAIEENIKVIATNALSNLFVEKLFISKEIDVIEEYSLPHSEAVITDASIRLDNWDKNYFRYINIYYESIDYLSVDGYKFVVTNNKAVIINIDFQVTTNNNKLEIPNELLGYEVYGINWFFIYPNSITIEELILPNTLYYLDDYIFKEFRRLYSVVLPLSVKVLGSEAFNENTFVMLEHESVSNSFNPYWNYYSNHYKTGFKGYVEDDDYVYAMFDEFALIHEFKFTDKKFKVIPDKVNGKIVVGVYNRQINYDIKAVIFPIGFLEIGKSVFEDYTNLEMSYIPKTVNYIGDNAFKEKVSLYIGNYKIGDNWEASFIRDKNNIKFNVSNVIVEDDLYYVIINNKAHLVLVDNNEFRQILVIPDIVKEYIVDTIEVLSKSNDIGWFTLIEL